MSSESGTSISGEHHAGSPDTEYVLDVTPNAWRRDSNLAEYSNATRGQWADYYNVHAQFLPWEHQKMNGFEILRKTTDFLTSRPATAKTVSIRHIMEQLGAKNHTGESTNMDDLALLHGWWRGGRTSSGPYYCNPDYPHDHQDDECAIVESGGGDFSTRGDGYAVERRLGLLDRAARLGLPARVLIAPFGASNRDTPLKWASRNGFDWGARQKEGIVRMARTFKTIHSWGNLGDSTVTHREIGAAFGVDGTTVTKRISRHAPHFEPPRDPNYRKVVVGR